MAQTSKQTIYIVVAAYNEAKYLKPFLKKLSSQTKNIIVVDDGSDDKSVEIAQQFTKHVLVHAVNLGKGASMKTGADYAFKQLKASAVIFMDGDDQHDPQDLAKFYQELIKNRAQLVFGVRSFKKGMPGIRIFGNYLTSFLVQIFFGSNIPDIPSGFKALSSKSYRYLRWKSSDYGVELEIACRTAKLRLPFATVEIKTIYHDLNRGMSITDTIKMMHKILLWRINL